MLYNYNLPPDICFHDDKVIYLGVVPRPKKPVDFDLFLWLLIEEMFLLAIGIDAWDSDANKAFKLRAYLILVFGNIPAVSMMMRMKGHNGRRPCCACNIKGVCAPGTTRGPLYVPLNWEAFPDSEEPEVYNPLHLPRRTHKKILDQACRVQSAAQENTHKALATEFGIKGVLLLLYLPSILFPDSFPYNFMHLLWENVIPNLQELWTGKFKGMDAGTSDFKLDPETIKIIGDLGEKAGSFVLYAFGACPKNWASDKVSWAAKSCSFWTLFIAPVLLKGRLPEPYYDHFIQLVKLLNICLKYNMDCSKIQVLRKGFADWVKQYKE